MALKLRTDAIARNGSPYLIATDGKVERMYCVEFAVVGRGPFPFDMLRRDFCHPLNEGEASSMGYGHEHSEPRIVKLRAWTHDKWWSPTYDRWRSMGWTVVTAGPDAQKVWPNG